MATKEQIEQFINKMADPVIRTCKARGWGVPSAIIAQAGLESAWGTSGLSTSCFNYWGMKWVEGCGTNYKEYSTKEQRPGGTYYTVVARFRKWNTPSEGIEGYFKFIESYKRYKPVMQAKNYAEYATQLKSCGWATSLTYATNIINTVRKYSLDRFDNFGVVPKVENNAYEVGKVYTLKANLYIRTDPYGDKIKHTCITQDAMKHAYFDNLGYTILQKGTRVTCKDVKKLVGSTWILIPSGWVCAIEEGKVYIE